MNDPINFVLFREITNGDTDTEKLLVEVFISSSIKHMAGMETALRDNANIDWREYAHSMKGASLSLGAERLGSLCKDAQDSFEADNETKNHLLAAIQAELTHVREYLEKIYPLG